MPLDTTYGAKAEAMETPELKDTRKLPLTVKIVDGKGSASTVGLISSSGHFVEGDDPRPFGVEAMTQAEAEQRIDEFLREAPVLSEIPSDTPPEALVVRHGGYDVTSTRRDPNVAFPSDRLREAKLREDPRSGWQNGLPVPFLIPAHGSPPCSRGPPDRCPPTRETHTDATPVDREA